MLGFEVRAIEMTCAYELWKSSVPSLDWMMTRLLLWVTVAPSPR